MDRTGSHEEICKACPYARFEYERDDYGNYQREHITCNPPMGECRLEFNADNGSIK